MDYEHAYWTAAGRRSWTMAPEVVPENALLRIGYAKDRILRYPGIKEDVYAPAFRPDSSVRRRLALDEQDLVVTIRPPATEAHYHNPESDKLLYTVFEMISQRPDVKVVLLPRTPHQEAELRKQWPELFKAGKIIVPAHVIDGLDLIWCSDLVISGGGTMNREAAALGVPVYSTFRGKTGAVDDYLASEGRLILLQSADDVRSKIKLVRRNTSAQLAHSGQRTLQTVVEHIARLAAVYS
jgi:predicted glycosyltransferase